MEEKRRGSAVEATILKLNQIDRAALPIQNSLGGSIHRNYDLLLRHRLHIVGEVKFAGRHCLLVDHGVKVEELRALAQCENTLTKLGLITEAVDDTAGAAKILRLYVYVDFEASMADENAQKMCLLLKPITGEFATFLRVLGSHPVDTSMM
ncbi:hypothetical protein NC651_023721 [Populus alba x Populus x berolinensis]|nr:hypothetical protein NC651_023721 [Populus alba x Populus x berolinensis]